VIPVIESNVARYVSSSHARHTRRTAIAVTIAILVVAGCKPTTPPPPPPPAATKTVVLPPEGQLPDAQTQQQMANVLADYLAVDALITGEKAAESDAASTPATPATAPSAPPAAAPPAFGVERILVFAPQSPVIVELRLSIDGQPHVEALNELVADVLKLSDTDGDGRAMWNELTASPRFKYGQFGNLPIDTNNGPKQVVEKYDIDRDGVVDDTELPRFLTRNAGGSRPFSIRGMVDNSPSALRDAPLWRLLDVDDDGRLSAEEVATSPQRLRSRDADDDEILISAELQPVSAAMPGAMPARRRGGREGARLLGHHAQWDAVRTTLEEQYALGAALKAEHFTLAPKLFAHLDADGDGRVRKKEFERLNDAPADVILSIDFRNAATTPTVAPADTPAATETPETDKAGSSPSPPPKPRLQLVQFGDDLLGDKSAKALGDDRLLLQVGGSMLLVYLNDTLAQTNYAQQAEQSLAMFDGDKNGYLETAEFSEQAQATVGRFDAVDTDVDGKVYAGEIATYLAQQQQALRSQIHSRVQAKPDGLLEVLDRNEDSRIDSREVEGTAERLRSLDLNGDEEIDLDEVPAGLVLGIARGNLENQEGLFAMMVNTAAPPASDAPRWFQQMDANRDGSISGREFLGPLELFEKLDANADGFLTVDESSGS
jgi:Ca2+-binding EF-hand superfamily protein